MFSVYYRTPRDEALRVLFLVEQEPARLTRLRELYTASHDVLDALWWRLHPRETSPRGVPDPVLERDGLQRQTYSRAGEAAPTLEHRDPLTGADIRLTADEHRLRALDSDLAADARALDAAVARFVADYPAGEAPGSSASSDRPAAAVAVAAAADAPPALTAPTTRRRTWLVATVIAMAALLALTVSFATRLEQVSQRLDSLTEASIADPRSRWDEVDASSAAALSIFNRAQSIDDVYPLQLPAAFDLRDVRELRPEIRSGAFRLFAVLAHPGDVCLVAVLPDLSSSSACSAVRDFAENGLTVTTHPIAVADDPDPMTRQITWRPNGSIVLAVVR